MATKSRFDTVVDKLHGEMENRIGRIVLAMRTERAPGRQPVPEHEQLAQYVQMRQDPQAWNSIIQQHGLKSALKYRQTMEKKLQRTKDRVLKQFEGMNDIPGMENAPLPQTLLDAMPGNQPAADPMSQQGPVPAGMENVPQ